MAERDIDDFLQVDPQTFRKAASEIERVAEEMAAMSKRDWSGPDGFGDDELGRVIHQLFAHFAEPMSPMMEASHRSLGDHGGGLRIMADRYEATELSSAEGFNAVANSLADGPGRVRSL
ncbi:hypothetical protein GCM10022226_73510 [Sphaerisporangium flaviroseum]|uniref:WXG100 family type VII secretion target n=1 Tax=Sphaerisporangium flaviroseum TaxID=509199 RepID=A0ABP7JBQ9_9ACTN